MRPKEEFKPDENRRTVKTDGNVAQKPRQLRGKWIHSEDAEDGWCSICHCDMPMFREDCGWKYCETPYCPNCGARMEDKQMGSLGYYLEEKELTRLELIHDLWTVMKWFEEETGGAYPLCLEEAIILLQEEESDGNAGGDGEEDSDRDDHGAEAERSAEKG